MTRLGGRRTFESYTVHSVFFLAFFGKGNFLSAVKSERVRVLTL